MTENKSILKDKKRNFSSLKLSLLYSLMLGICLALVAFFLFRIISYSVIQNRYLSEESKKQRENSYVADLQEYADEKKISHSDVDLLGKWAKGQKYLYVLIYKDDQLLFDSGSYKEPENKPADELPGEGDGTEQDAPSDVPDENESVDPDAPAEEGEEKDPENDFPDSGITIDYPSREDLLKYAAENDSHLITLSDANVLVSMADYTEYFYYDIFNITSVILAMSVLILVVMLHFRRVTVRILKLAEDVNAVAEGDMDRHIHQDGRDELGKLCSNVEMMRSNIVTNLAKERAALDSNAELITSMSHDLRTPLTVLLGYIDVMKSHSTDGVMKEYLDASESTAMRLKKLSDDLFNYFLVFGGDISSIKLESYDCPMLLEQLLSEHVLLLREMGYTVNFSLDEGAADLVGYTVNTDAPQLMRVIDNLFSNIGKYADKTAPVSILIEIKGGKCQLLFTNKVKSDLENAKSNGIGIKTCEKLCSAIRADFSVERERDTFVARLGLICDEGGL